ncbi:MAG: 4Fe-4S binding protein [Lachnospiraceae bacterium]
MDAKTCIEKLKLVGVLSFATVDSKGNPQIRCISAIHFDKDSFYFFTARGKDFFGELLENGKVQILAYTRFKEMIRLSAKAEPAPESEQEEKINTIFAQQPYLSNIYPGDTRKIGMIFEIRNAEIEYFNLGVKPIFRESYTLGAGTLSEKGYIISDSCIGCGKCQRGCPQQCITSGTPYRIQQEHCLHCGNCYENCPVKEVWKRGVK